MGALHGYSIARRIEQMSGNLPGPEPGLDLSGIDAPRATRLDCPTKWGVSETNRK